MSVPAAVPGNLPDSELDSKLMVGLSRFEDRISKVNEIPSKRMQAYSAATNRICELLSNESMSIRTRKNTLTPVRVRLKRLRGSDVSA